MLTRTEHSKPINQQLPIASWIWRNVHHFSISFLNTSHAGCLGGMSAPSYTIQKRAWNWVLNPTSNAISKCQTSETHFHLCSYMFQAQSWCKVLWVYINIWVCQNQHFRSFSLFFNCQKLGPTPNFGQTHILLWRRLENHHHAILDLLNRFPKKILVDSPNGGLIIGKIKKHIFRHW